MKPKYVYNLGDDDIQEDYEINLYHVSFLNNILTNADGNLRWVRTGVEGLEVDDE